MVAISVLSIVREIGKGRELSHEIDLENWDMSRPTRIYSRNRKTDALVMLRPDWLRNYQ